jgi:hypothetical protein
MQEEKKHPQNVSGIVSYVPGRMRIKLHPGSRRPAFMDRLKEHMETQEGMHRTTLNHTAGSVTLHDDRDRLTKESVLGLLEALDVVTKEISPAFAGDTPDGVDETGTQLSFLQAITVRVETARVLAGVPRDALTAEQRAMLDAAQAEYVATPLINADRPEAYLIHRASQYLIGGAHTTGAGPGLTLACGGRHHARCGNLGDHDRVATVTHLFIAHRGRIRRRTHATFPAAGGATSGCRIHRTGGLILRHLGTAATGTRCAAHGNGRRWHGLDSLTRLLLDRLWQPPHLGCYRHGM